jgi:hypothetical protein
VRPVATLTNEEIQHLGFEALIEKLGYEGALRFLTNIRRGQGDYLVVRDQVFGDMTVEQIHDDAAAFEEAHPEVMEGKEVV